METQKIINLLDDSEDSKFATKKWCAIGSQTAKGKYNQNNSIKFETETIQLTLFDYSNAFILVTRDITVNADNNAAVAFESCASFSTCETEINDLFIHEANHIYFAMPTHSLTEYSNNYSDTSGSLWQFKIDEVPTNNADLTIDNSESFKYKVALVGKIKSVSGGNSFVKNTKIVVPLGYLSNFWRSLELLLVNCKIHLELNWIEDCILSSDRYSEKFKITDATLHVPIVTLSTKYNVNLTKQLSNGFKRFFCWNNYQTIPAKLINQKTDIMSNLMHHFKALKDYLFFLIMPKIVMK